VIRTPRSPRRRLAAGLALACALLAAAPAAASADYATGLRLGAEAYQYGFPITEMNRIYTTSTSVNVPDGNGHGPVNRFSHTRKFADASERMVNAPNNDTPYSVAWLDLRRGPVVLHAPAIRNRFWEFELLDPWTNDFYNISSVSKAMGPGQIRATGGGDWAVVGPRFHGRLPRGVKRVRSPYDRVWVLGRTHARSEADLRNVRRIQDAYSITPLSRFGTRYRPPAPRHPDRTLYEALPAGTGPGVDPLSFYSVLDRQMALFPPPARDRPLLARLRAIGVGPGLDVTRSGLDAETLRGMRDAVTQGPGKLTSAFLQRYLAGFDRHHGYFVSDLGNWGTDYALRAILAKIGIGGQRATIATYPVAVMDDTKALLNGSKRYVLRLPRSSLPIPVKAFWSLTLYDGSSYFVPNSLNRYLVNQRSGLHRAADGSITIYVQHDRPSSAAQVDNWLPAPASGPFRLIWRLYDPGAAVRGILDGSGWQPPRIEPCDPGTGHAATGVACAS